MDVRERVSARVEMELSEPLVAVEVAHLEVEPLAFGPAALPATVVVGLLHREDELVLVDGVTVSLAFDRHEEPLEDAGT